jgi:hypothetical protein
VYVVSFPNVVGLFGTLPEEPLKPEELHRGEKVEGRNEK